MAKIRTTGNGRIDDATAEIAIALRDRRPGWPDENYYREAERLRDEILAGHRAMLQDCRGQADVARWCGVTRAAVTNWMKRHVTPEPDAVIVSENGDTTRGWLPGRRSEWETFAAELNASPPAVARKKNRLADTIVQGVKAGDIDAAEAVELLRELILCGPGTGRQPSVSERRKDQVYTGIIQLAREGTGDTK